MDVFGRSGLFLVSVGRSWRAWRSVNDIAAGNKLCGDAGLGFRCGQLRGPHCNCWPMMPAPALPLTSAVRVHPRGALYNLGGTTRCNESATSPQGQGQHGRVELGGISNHLPYDSVG